MAFMKGFFGGKKSKSTDEAYYSDRSNAISRSPARDVRTSAPGKDSARSNGRDDTEEDMESMKYAKQKPVSKKDRNLSISRSGRHKYINKQRISVLKDDIYSDIPADQDRGGSANKSMSSSTASPSSGSGGYRPYSHQRTPLTNTNTPTAV